MKKLSTAILILLSNLSYAGARYVSNSGSDSNPGTLSQPYATIAKVNAIFGTISAGDSILFNRGDVFYGQLIPSISGGTSARIVIGAYGTGVKPVIHGMVTLSGWTNISGNVWESSATTALKGVNIVTINGTPVNMGRYPNSSYLQYQTLTLTTLTSSSLSGAPSYVGAQCVLLPEVWSLERFKITAQGSNTFTLAKTRAHDNGGAGGYSSGHNGFGFFMQNFASSLDAQNEWFFDTTTLKMRMYSTTNPSSWTVKASAIDTLIKVGNKSNITFENIKFEGANCYAMYIYNGSNNIIRNCTFDNNFRAGYAWNSFNTTFDSDSINNTLNLAILVSNNQQKQITITNNVITNTGQLLGAGSALSNYTFKGIVARTDTTRSGNFVNIWGNKVLNTGLSPIEFQGSNVTVVRNYVDTFCNSLQDNGGIYTFNTNTGPKVSYYSNRRIDSNIIINSIGSPAGANGEVDVAGYYLDDQSQEVTGQYNTIANIPGNGVQMNTPTNNTFRNNTIYNCTYLMAIGKKQYDTLHGNVIAKNILYQNTSSQFLYFYYNTALNLPTPQNITTAMKTMARIDSNYVTNLRTQGIYTYYANTYGGAYTFINYTLAQWQSNYLHDVHAVLPVTPVTSTNTRLYINPSDTILQVNFLDTTFRDPKGVLYTNSANIPRWGSLIATLVSVNTRPTVSPIGNIAITQPLTSTTVSGTATDPGGAVTAYQFSEIFRPAGAPATTFTTPNSNSTIINNLNNVGNYGFKWKVTGNAGSFDTSSTTFTVTVNPSVTPPNTPPVFSPSTIAPQIKTLPTVTTTATASATDNVAVTRYEWYFLSGPSGATISNKDIATPTFGWTLPGVYQWRVAAFDIAPDSTSTTWQLTVNSAPTTAPIPDAGLDTTVYSPTTAVTLNGSGTNGLNCNITSNTWELISNPAASFPVITDASNYNSAITNLLIPGAYVVRLKLTSGCSADVYDYKTINVLPPVVPDTGCRCIPFLIKMQNQ